MRRHYLLVLIPVIFVTIGQAFAKYGVLEIEKNNNSINSFIILGYTMLILRGFVWVYILKKVKLSFAYPLMSVTFIIILAISINYPNDLLLGFIVGVIWLFGGFLLVTNEFFKRKKNKKLRGNLKFRS